jgi:hypothetical protein
MSRALRAALALLTLAGCPPVDVPTPPPEPTPVTDGLQATLRLARACAGGAPIAGQGEGGSPLLMETGMVIEPTGDGRWAVHFGEESPESAPYGARVEVDPAAGTCAGHRWPLPADAAPGPSLSRLLSAAHTCAVSHAATGVGGTPLRAEGIRLAVVGNGNILASVPEAEVRTLPTGMDVVLGADGQGCARAPMD